MHRTPIEAPDGSAGIEDMAFCCRKEIALNHRDRQRDGERDVRDRDSIEQLRLDTSLVTDLAKGALDGGSGLEVAF